MSKEEDLRTRTNQARYDLPGRVTETGEVTATESSGALQAMLEDATFPDGGTYGCGKECRTMHTDTGSQDTRRTISKKAPAGATAPILGS